jgi:hypothetical protein
MSDTEKTYTQEALDAAVAHAIADVNYKAEVAKRLDNLETLTKQANGLKRDIIDLINRVDAGHNAKLDRIQATIESHIEEPGHPSGLQRLEDIEEQVGRFGMASIGDDDAMLLRRVLRRAAQQPSNEEKNWRLGNMYYRVAIPMAILSVVADFTWRIVSALHTH